MYLNSLLLNEPPSVYVYCIYYIQCIQDIIVQDIIVQVYPVDS